MTIEPIDAPLDNVHTAATTYSKLGWAVVPIKPGQKYPPLPAWQDAATSDPDTIDSWWTGLYRDHGVGIATGPKSGIFVLDIDIANGKPGEETLTRLEATHGPLPPTTTAITGSGGRHLYFALPHGTDIRNNAATRLGPGLDIRGAGGQVVAPPTQGTKNAYQWLTPPWETPPAQPPNWLLQLLTDTPQPATPPAVNTSDDSDSIAGRYNQNTTWEQLLTDDGWTHAETLPDGEQRWTRPGKDRRQGASATIFHKGRDCLKVFTDGVDGLEQEKAYSRFGYTAAVHWNGDRSAFARQLRQQTDIPHLDHNPEANLPDPIPLHTGHRHGPPFPLHTLPAWIADMVNEVAYAFQVPADLPAMLSLGSLATLTASKIQVNLAESNWTEHTNLYLVTAMPPGSGKSPVFKKMMKAVREIEKQSIQHARTATIEYEQQRRLTEQRLKHQETIAVKGTKEDARMASIEMTELALQLDTFQRPPNGHMIVEDITPEALVETLADNGGRLALLSSEGGVFDMMAGQYMDRGKATNLAVYLQGWSADEVRRKRKGSDDYIIPEAILTICVTTQPGVVANLGLNKELVRKGVPTRFMYAFPPSLVGYRSRERVRTQINPDTEHTYYTLMTAIGQACLEATDTTVLYLDPDASDTFIAWDQELEDRQRPEGDLNERAEWAAKLRASVMRTAALLHIARSVQHGHPTRHTHITHDTLQDALTIGSYWLEHAEVAERMWNDDADTTRAAILLDVLINYPNNQDFTLRDAYGAKRGTFTTADDVVNPLQTLIDRHWVIPKQPEPVAKSGRGKTGQRFQLRSDAASALRATAQPAQLNRQSDQVARVARVAREERVFISPSHTPAPQNSEPHAQPAQPAQLPPATPILAQPVDNSRPITLDTPLI